MKSSPALWLVLPANRLIGLSTDLGHDAGGGQQCSGGILSPLIGCHRPHSTNRYLSRIMETLTYLSNSLVLQLWSLRKTDSSIQCMSICVCYWDGPWFSESEAFMTLMRYDGLDLSEHELKVLLKAQYLRSLSVCVCVPLSISTILKNRKHYFHPTSCLFIHLSCLSSFHFLNLSATSNHHLGPHSHTIPPPQKCHCKPNKAQTQRQTGSGQVGEDN